MIKVVTSQIQSYKEKEKRPNFLNKRRNYISASFLKKIEQPFLSKKKNT